MSLLPTRHVHRSSLLNPPPRPLVSPTPRPLVSSTTRPMPRLPALRERCSTSAPTTRLPHPLFVLRTHRSGQMPSPSPYVPTVRPRRVATRVLLPHPLPLVDTHPFASSLTSSRPPSPRRFAFAPACRGSPVTVMVCTASNLLAAGVVGRCCAADGC
ncbi:hypothetical protein CPC08DRAFT_771619 [Agrocybe pediades]|nr:hypothetical protein CPC08DRAFT_771619 [Agrocybe pediades]